MIRGGVIPQLKACSLYLLFHSPPLVTIEATPSSSGVLHRWQSSVQIHLLLPPHRKGSER